MDNYLLMMKFPDKCILPMRENAVDFFHYQGLRWIEISVEEVPRFIKELRLFYRKRKRLLEEQNTYK